MSDRVDEKNSQKMHCWFDVVVVFRSSVGLQFGNSLILVFLRCKFGFLLKRIDNNDQFDVKDDNFRNLNWF